MRAVRKVSAGDGMDWAVIVKFKDSRKVDKEARVSCGDAVTEPSKCIHELASAGLLIHVEDPKLFRLVLKSVVHADVPLAYRLVKAGWFPIGVCSRLRVAVRASFLASRKKLPGAATATIAARSSAAR